MAEERMTSGIQYRKAQGTTNEPVSISRESLSLRVPVRRPKRQVPETLKDEKYWEKRNKNNLAAKRSRESRRRSESSIRVKIGLLEEENSLLKKEVCLLKSRFGIPEENSGLTHQGRVSCLQHANSGESFDFIEREGQNSSTFSEGTLRKEPFPATPDGIKKENIAHGCYIQDQTMAVYNFGAMGCTPVTSSVSGESFENVGHTSRSATKSNEYSHEDIQNFKLNNQNVFPYYAPHRSNGGQIPPTQSMRGPADTAFNVSHGAKRKYDGSFSSSLGTNVTGSSPNLNLNPTKSNDRPSKDLPTYRLERENQELKQKLTQLTKQFEAVKDIIRRSEFFSEN